MWKPDNSSKKNDSQPTKPWILVYHNALATLSKGVLLLCYRREQYSKKKFKKFPKHISIAINFWSNYYRIAKQLKLKYDSCLKFVQTIHQKVLQKPYWKSWQLYKALQYKKLWCSNVPLIHFNRNWTSVLIGGLCAQSALETPFKVFSSIPYDNMLDSIKPNACLLDWLHTIPPPRLSEQYELTAHQESPVQKLRLVHMWAWQPNSYLTPPQLMQMCQWGTQRRDVSDLGGLLQIKECL